MELFLSSVIQRHHVKISRDIEIQCHRLTSQALEIEEISKSYPENKSKRQSLIENKVQGNPLFFYAVTCSLFLDVCVV